MFEGSASNSCRDFGAPVLAVCGFSGSGKTTLLEAAIPHLIAAGLSIAVIKHDAHGFSVDQEGKDSDRFFRAGATVVLRGPSEQFERRGGAVSLSLETTLADLAHDHDLVLVEGHKDTHLPKVWLTNERNSSAPKEVTEIWKTLPWGSDRLHKFLRFIKSWLPSAWDSRPLFAGLLVGRNSSSMRAPKELFKSQYQILAEITATALTSVLPGDSSESRALADARIAILGAGPVPSALENVTRLANVPSLLEPLAGLLAAHRWHPRAAWIVAVCDYSWPSHPELEMLVNHRKPGTWAVMLRQPNGHPSPGLALLEPQALEVLERALLVRGPENVGIAELSENPHTLILPHATQLLFDPNTSTECNFGSRHRKKNQADAKRARKKISEQGIAVSACEGAL